MTKSIFVYTFVLFVFTSVQTSVQYVKVTTDDELICPNKSVTIKCVTNTSSLMWIHPVIKEGSELSFLRSNRAGITGLQYYSKHGLAALLLETEPELVSMLIITNVSIFANSTTVTCVGRDNENDTVAERPLDVPRAPSNPHSVVVSGPNIYNYAIKISWNASTDHVFQYQVKVILDDQLYETLFVQNTTTSIVFGIDEEQNSGMVTANVSAINKCGQTSEEVSSNSVSLQNLELIIVVSVVPTTLVVLIGAVVAMIIVCLCVMKRKKNKQLKIGTGNEPELLSLLEIDGAGGGHQSKPQTVCQQAEEKHDNANGVTGNGNGVPNPVDPIDSHHDAIPERDEKQKKGTLERDKKQKKGTLERDKKQKKGTLERDKKQKKGTLNGKAAGESSDRHGDGSNPLAYSDNPNSEQFDTMNRRKANRRLSQSSLGRTKVDHKESKENLIANDEEGCQETKAAGESSDRHGDGSNPLANSNSDQFDTMNRRKANRRLSQSSLGRTKVDHKESKENLIIANDEEGCQETRQFENKVDVKSVSSDGVADKITADNPDNLAKGTDPSV